MDVNTIIRAKLDSQNGTGRFGEVCIERAKGYLSTRGRRRRNQQSLLSARDEAAARAAA